MNWTERYSNKTCTAQEAIKQIQNGQRVVFSHAAATPQEVAHALAQNAANYKNVEIFHMLCLGPGEYMAPEAAGHLKHITNFVGANSRVAVEENRADFYPIYFHQIPHLMRSGELHVDVAVIHVSEPNEEGYCSFGISSDYTKPAAECASVVIAEVNKQMPFIGGDNLIHMSKIDCAIPVDYPLYTLPAPQIGEVERSIGLHCADLIPDGATLQLGIGAIPDAVLLFLKDKKDLGIHTEMFSDGVVELVEAGVINGRGKTLHPGKMVATFLMGSPRLYDFVNNNPSVELYPVDYVNNPAVIAQNENMISINSCIEVDLMGQVVSESIGDKQFSGVGGQVDYVRGATMAEGGKSIIAIPATARKGKASRIVAHLTEGAAVTTSRNDVDYIVTEFGVAHLRGKSLRERAKALISIAHPDFRDELLQFYHQKFGE